MKFTLKNTFLLVALMILSPMLYAQLELNSSGTVGIAGAYPSTSFGLRVNGKISTYSQVYGSAFGSSGSTYNGKSLKIYGGSGETTWNVLLTSSNPGELHINGAKIMTTSDDRLKKDKKKIEGASALLNGIKGHTYYYKSAAELKSINLGGNRRDEMDTILVNGELVAVDPSKQKFTFSKAKQYGFIAQEVKEAFPELVSYDSASGTYGVDYMSFIPILVEANKELVARQETLEERLGALEKEMEKLKKGDQKTETSNSRVAEPQEATDETGSAEIFQNSPNPFNEQTEIKISLPGNVAEAQLFIYDMQGRQVRSIRVPERGNTLVRIGSGELRAGMYMYTLIADGREVGTKKMILTD